MIITYHTHKMSVECNIDGLIIGWHYECDSVFINLLIQLNVIDPLNKLNHPSISGNLYLTKNSYHKNWLPLFTKSTDIKIASSWGAITL